MKVTVNNTDTNTSKPFPKLMIAIKEGIPDKGIIVLFEEEEKGTVVYTPNDYKKLGYKSNTFLMNCFTDFNGSITLSND